jgi:branched-chain amino acid transport system permease protein
VPKGFWFWFGTGLAALLIPLLYHTPYFLSVLVLGCIYFTINLMWSLVVGTAGLYSFATLAIVGISAYASAWLCVKHGWAWYATIPVAIVVGSVVGLLVALPAVRLRGVYFALLTIGLVELCRSYVTQDRGNFGGAQGLTGSDTVIPADEVGTVSGYAWAYAAVLVIVVISLLVYWWVSAGTLGLRLRTARESEPVAQGLGIDVPRARLYVFVVTSAVLGLVGSYKAAYAGSAVPSDFAFTTLLILFAMIVVGGLNSPRGILIGTALIHFIDQRFIDQGASRFIALGVMMLIITLVTTNGLAGLPAQVRTWIRDGDGGDGDVDDLSGEREQEQTVTPEVAGR